MNTQAISELNDIINNAKNIVFFGGAGVSTESGIPDFRSVDGVYSGKYRYPAEYMVSHTFYTQNPREFFEFYFDKMVAPNALPNPAHKYLAKLEHRGKLSAIITQNIDGLHQAAGSKYVYELHGSIHRNYCEVCHKFFDLAAMLNLKPFPKCDKCGGPIKPDVVLYEEPLPMDQVEGAIKAIQKADVLIIGGTSLKVYPAAGLINYFSGDKLVVINMSPSPANHLADLVINAPIGATFEALDHLNK